MIGFSTLTLKEWRIAASLHPPPTLNLGPRPFRRRRSLRPSVEWRMREGAVRPGRARRAVGRMRSRAARRAYEFLLLGVVCVPAMRSSLSLLTLLPLLPGPWIQLGQSAGLLARPPSSDTINSRSRLEGTWGASPRWEKIPWPLCSGLECSVRHLAEIAYSARRLTVPVAFSFLLLSYHFDIFQM